MAKLTIEIDCENDTFSDRYSMRNEILRITGAIAARIEDGETEGTGRDSNGNTCARWELTDNA